MPNAYRGALFWRGPQAMVGSRAAVELTQVQMMRQIILPTASPRRRADARELFIHMIKGTSLGGPSPLA